MQERFTIVTGATGAMGAAATAALARQGYPVIMACRDLRAAAEVRDRIVREIPDAVLEIKELHLESLSAVREFAASVESFKLGGLFNNAGTMERHYRLSDDGYEMTFAVNYLGPWLLTKLLLPRLDKVLGVVNMVSLSCLAARFDKHVFEPYAQKFSQLGSYSSSKLALMFLSIALARENIVNVNVADPGIVNTDMIRLHRWFDPLTDVLFRPFCNSPAKGASPAVRALLTDVNGMMFRGKGFVAIPHRYADRHEDIDWLYRTTDNIIYQQHE